jgi:hypothetical protein
VTSASTAVQADIFFLSDTTGSMGGTISSVETAAGSILSGTAGLGNIAWGVGEYRDFGDSFVYRLNQAVTTTQAAVTTGINAWSASGGGDLPEANLFALTQVAGEPSWRAGSQKIGVWFGDAVGHDPSGLSTLATTTAALLAAGAKVIAFDVGNLDGLGQATAIATATGGSYHDGLGGDPAQTIIDAITASFATYSSVCLDTSGSPAAVGTVASPACINGSFDRSIDRTFDFDVTFTANGPAGVYDFDIHATVDGGIVATEADTITISAVEDVPEPGTLALVGLSLIGLGFLRRRFST